MIDLYSYYTKNGLSCKDKQVNLMTVMIFEIENDIDRTSHFAFFSIVELHRRVRTIFRE